MTNDTETLTLTDFLLARLTEESEAFQWDDFRRADCAAKRRVAAELVRWERLPSGLVSDTAVNVLRNACGDLASVYSEHPDFREEWKP